MIKQVITDGCRIPIKIWNDVVEDSALQQLKNNANHPYSFKHISAMPDVHAGYGLTIGGVAAYENVVVPYAVGVDIACGMIAVNTKLSTIGISENQLQKIVNDIKQTVPMGNGKYGCFTNYKDSIISDLYKSIDNLKYVDKEIVTHESLKKQLGSLGGGNHFIELQKDENNELWIMIHSGSRNLGKKVCDKYHYIAKTNCNKWKSNIPTLDLSFLYRDTYEFNSYFDSMLACMEFSYFNRLVMLDLVKNTIENHYGKCKYVDSDIINIHHNFARLENHFGKNVYVHRKGATSARKNELGIIPGSMGTKSFIVRGLGNPDSFSSCSHGAGRKLGRKQAERELSIDDFKNIMKNVISNDINIKHLDESPFAYKDINDVIEYQSDLVDIIHTLEPIANCKG